MKYGFGVDLGGTTAKIAFFSDDGTLLEKWEIPTVTKNNGSQILPDIASSIETYCASHRHGKDDILGIGIGVPGPVDGHGNVIRCVNLGWGVFNIQQTLASLSGLPVKAGNDANVAALGEYWMGGGAGSENMLLVTLGTGVGGGIVIGGRLLHGTHGSAAEIGHLVINRDETEKCGCGKRGCVEQYCSATGIVRLAKKRLEKDSSPCQLRDLSELTCKDVFDAGKAGDSVALEILDRYYAFMGEFLANVCDVVDPDVVVLGGGVSKAGQMLLNGIQPYYQKYAFHAVSSVRFALASLGNDAGAYGAFKLIADSYNGKQ